MTTQAKYEALAEDFERQARETEREIEEGDLPGDIVEVYTSIADEARLIARACRIAAAAEGQEARAWLLEENDVSRLFFSFKIADRYAGQTGATVKPLYLVPPPAPDHTAVWNEAIEAAAVAYDEGCAWEINDDALAHIRALKKEPA